MSHQPDNISAGTQVVALVEMRGPNKSACMHPPRLLITGAATLREARVPVRVGAHRERLLLVKGGEMPWSEVDTWRKEVHQDIERALAETKLPERTNYEAADRSSISARQEMVVSCGCNRR